MKKIKIKNKRRIKCSRCGSNNVYRYLNDYRETGWDCGDCGFDIGLLIKPNIPATKIIHQTVFLGNGTKRGF